MNSTHTKSKAVVIGGSIAGLLAAHVLAETFDEVTVLDRDHYPETPDSRRGVPQSHFIHIYLSRGQEILKQFFPGIEAELVNAGAVRIDWTQDTALYTAAGWARRKRRRCFGAPAQRLPSDLTGWNCSRNLVEWTIRQRLMANPRVCFRQGCEVTGLLATQDSRQVSGVMIRPRGQASQAEQIVADWVVDASGRSSRAPDWLSKLGYPRSEETVINSFLGYAARWYMAPPGSLPDWKLLLIRNQPPHDSHWGGISRVEEERFIVTLGGVGEERPPTDDAGFLEFTRSLPTSEIYDWICAARPISPIYGYRRTENRWRHWERLKSWPERFVLLGDAVCAFNPIYGQGMTAAALGALALHQCLSEALGKAGRLELDGLARRFQHRVAKANKTPWLMATGEDFRWPTTIGGKPGPFIHLMHRYLDRIVDLIPVDPALYLAFLQVAHLVRPPAELFRPRIFLRVLKHSLAQSGASSTFGKLTEANE